MSLKLDVSKVSADKAALSEKQITLNLVLPSGAKETLQFRSDLTVGYVKLALQTKHKLPYDHQEFTFNGKAMADPLSLADFPNLDGATITVTVEGDAAHADDDHGDAADGDHADDHDDLDDQDLA